MRKERGIGLDVESANPVGLWTLPPQQSRPLLKFTFPSNKENGELLNPGKMVDEGIIKITIEKLRTGERQTLLVPLTIWKPHANHFFNEDIIDLGILTISKSYAEYTLRIGNSLDLPALVKNISIEVFEKGMTLNFFINGKHLIPLAPNTKRFNLIRIHAIPDKISQIGLARGTITFLADVAGKEYTYSVDIIAGYVKDLFGSQSKFNFQTHRQIQENMIHNQFDVKVRASRGGNLMIRKISFAGDSYGQITFSDLSVHQEVSKGRATNAFSLKVEHPIAFYDEGFTHGFAKYGVHTLETIAHIATRYYKLGLMCNIQSMLDSSFKKCIDRVLNMQNIAIHHSKTILIDILNPTEINFFLEKISSNIDSEEMEISIETSNSLKPTQIEQRKVIYFVIEPHEVMTIKLKLRPNKLGNYKENLRLQFNHLNFSYELIYNVIEGSLLFTPSTLRFDIFYPKTKESKTISAKNKFGADVRLLSAWSKEPFITPKLKRILLRENHKTSVVSVNLNIKDAKKNIPDFAFLKRSTPGKITLADIYKHMLLEQGWDTLLNEAKTELSGEIMIETDIQNDVKVEVRGSVRRPQFFDSNVIFTGFQEEGKSNALFVRISNPTDVPVKMRFFVATEQMLNPKSLLTQAKQFLSKRFTNTMDDSTCISDTGINPLDMRNFAKTRFVNITIVQNKEDSSKFCFKENSNVFHNGSFFNKAKQSIFKISNEKLKKIKKFNKPLVLRDILEYSQNIHEPSNKTLWDLGFYEKILEVVKITLKNIVVQNQKRNTSDSKQKNNRDATEEKVISLRGLSRKRMKSVLSGQELFINKPYQKKSIVLQPKQTLRLPILSYLPKHNGDSSIMLLVKNNFTGLLKIPIVGQSGSSDLIVTRVHSETPEGLIEEHHSKKNKKRLLFKLEEEDFVNERLTGFPKDSIPQHFTKLYELKNVGRMPIVVQNVSIEKYGCYSNGIKINSCEGFQLQPNETHSFWIGFFPSNHAPVKKPKRIYFRTHDSIIYFPLEVKLPIHSVQEPTTPSINRSMNKLFFYQLVFSLMVLVVLMQRLMTIKLQTARLNRIEFARNSPVNIEDLLEISEEAKGWVSSSNRVPVWRNSKNRNITTIRKLVKILVSSCEKTIHRKVSAKISSPLKTSPRKEKMMLFTENSQQNLRTSHENNNTDGEKIPKKTRKDRKKQKKMERILDKLDDDIPPVLEIKKIEVSKHSKHIDRPPKVPSPSLIDVIAAQKNSVKIQKEISKQTKQDKKNRLKDATPKPLIEKKKELPRPPTPKKELSKQATPKKEGQKPQTPKKEFPSPKSSKKGVSGQPSSIKKQPKAPSPQQEAQNFDNTLPISPDEKIKPSLSSNLVKEEIASPPVEIEDVTPSLSDVMIPNAKKSELVVATPAPRVMEVVEREPSPPLYSHVSRTSSRPPSPQVAPVLPLQSLLDQNISAITNLEEQSDTSKMDTFIKGGSAGSSASDDSGTLEDADDQSPSEASDQFEKSSEIIRKLVGRAEDIEDDDSIDLDNSRSIGTIGARRRKNEEGVEVEERFSPFGQGNPNQFIGNLDAWRQKKSKVGNINEKDHEIQQPQPNHPPFVSPQQPYYGESQYTSLTDPYAGYYNPQPRMDYISQRGSYYPQQQHSEYYQYPDPYSRREVAYPQYSTGYDYPYYQRPLEQSVYGQQVYPRSYYGYAQEFPNQPHSYYPGYGGFDGNSEHTALQNLAAPGKNSSEINKSQSEALLADNSEDHGTVGSGIVVKPPGLFEELGHHDHSRNYSEDKNQNEYEEEIDRPRERHTQRKRLFDQLLTKGTSKAKNGNKQFGLFQ